MIDIPRSIVEAQGFNSSDDYDLLSSQPLQTPYPSTEPRSAKARAKLTDNTVDQALHAEYGKLLTQTLGEVKHHYNGKWYLPRRFVEYPEPRRKKRKLNDAEEPNPSQIPASDNSLDVAVTPKCPPDYYLLGLDRASLRCFDVQLKPALHVTEKLYDDYGDSHFQFNDSDAYAPISVSSPGDHSNVFNFYAPPKSAFYLGDCALSSTFRKQLRKHSQHRKARSDFDFILLDPPWPNRSVRRTHKTAGATYHIAASIEGVRDLIFDMQVESMAAEDALIGVWVTNKQAVRELVLGLGGFFSWWGVELVEEWIWLKTTTSGEPTSVPFALWKKPYEVLLLGRKRRRLAKDDHPKPPVKRRVIIGVPDLHSRKPCLKGLIEPMMPDPGNYKALEIFARHLVAGWCSWGDECIKFNWEGYWRRRNES